MDAGKPPKMRSDARRNRRLLLEAAGEVLRTEPHRAAMPLIAERAGLSVATAYRYYSSLEDLLNAYLHGVIVALRDYSHDCPRTGKALFEDVVHEWFRLLRLYGSAMVQLRAREGFLHRLRDNDVVISTVRDAWERPVRSVMRDIGVPDEEFDYALFLYNILFDPREILDLLDSGFSEEGAIRKMVATYYAALRGWTLNSPQPCRAR
ncbi:TetR/AcrR family transcriptional regulator [Pseudonocardia acaciae]|uniref:TetR/AcrR family transcriptional regulator n=1 Tax=Pseudonocardia acaciae TaxID=551276 RepID=UPI001FE0ED38|nr:TetR/AcrR family transcriptional regulator [Pseudonocardia acaciae]